MEPDYPAAHSMDTRWFAVDQKGQVAMFLTGENGPIPHSNWLGGVDILRALWRLSNPNRPEDEFYNDYTKEWVASLGIYSFNYQGDYNPIDLYKKDNRPLLPMHVDQLPPELRQHAKVVCFSQIDFATCDLFQPLEFISCFPYDEDEQVAYVCSDGKTVRPVPGHEEDFATDYRLYIEQGFQVEPPSSEQKTTNDEE